jgi:RimJ/RimL family protein N-acetyltransferase
VTPFARFVVSSGVELERWPYLLRPWESRDLAWLVDAANDAEIGRWTRLPHPFGARAGLDFLDRSRHGWATGSHLSFAVVVAESGWLVGSMSVSGDGELGWFTGPDARGRGVASSAAAALVDWLAGACPAVAPWAIIGAGNLGSERVAAAVGLTPTDEVSGECGGASGIVWRRST